MSQLAEQDDEIDLGELFAAIWYNWWIVGVATFVALFLSAFYAFGVAVPEYEASTRFELLEGNDSGPNLGQAASLAALAGVSIPGSSSEADAIQDRVLSRPFIESVYDRAEFVSDPVFNELLRDPGLVTKTVWMIRGPEEEKDLVRDDYLVMAIGSLKDRLVVAPGDNGIIELTISHPDGARAAHVANLIVEQTLLDIFERERSATREGLNYFADELLQVRADLDSANAAVRDYAVTNNLQSAEELARTSAQLAQVRRDIEDIEQSIRALNAMRVDTFLGSDFVQRHPVSTSLAFRRLLNLSGDPSDWEKPSEDEIKRALQRLEAQKSPLISTFNALELRAKSSGAEALQLAALQREVEVQQAIYESVITQFEARSLVSGFERASGRIVETAIAPNRPVSPRKSLILALGIVLGGFVGVAIALVRSMSRGALYTKLAIKDAFVAPEAHSLTSSQLASMDRSPLTAKQHVATQNFLVALSDADKIIPVATTHSEMLSARFALGLSKAAFVTEGRTAIVDFTQGAFARLTRGASGNEQDGFKTAEVYENVDLLEPLNPRDFMKAADCAKNLEGLASTYDRVFVVLPAPEKGMALSYMVAQSMDQLIVVAKRGKTKRAAVEGIKSTYSKSDISDLLLVIV